MLKPGDVLMALGGHPVGADGTSELDPSSAGRVGDTGLHQRVMFGHFANLASVGDTMRVEVVREGRRVGLEIWWVGSSGGVEGM